MSKSTDRYSGPAASTYSYMNEFIVHCPKCDAMATVSTNQSFDTSNDKLTCTNCHFVEMRDELIRYNAEILRNCDNCGKQINITIPDNKQETTELQLPCPHCHIKRTYKPKNSKYFVGYKSIGICDPVFNLPLWLQADVKGETLWAYNFSHLHEIRNYVSAKLRERQTSAFTTMVEKLPNFIKIGKNRVAVLKVIDKLLLK
jgi:DNA-directed RNA polymerase subunit RPC12/RpoP